MTTEPVSRQRIIAATLGLVADRGIADVSMSAVAAQAGVARQTLYNHFPDVESIVVAAYSHHHAENMAQLDRILATAPDPSAKLAQFIRYQVAAASHSHGRSRLEAGLSPEAQQRVHEQHQEIVDLLREILQTGTTSGEFRADLDPAATATLILHLMGGAGDPAVAGRDVPSIVAAVEALVFGGIRA